MVGLKNSNKPRLWHQLQFTVYSVLYYSIRVKFSFPEKATKIWRNLPDIT